MTGWDTDFKTKEQADLDSLKQSNVRLFQIITLAKWNLAHKPICTMISN